MYASPFCRGQSQQSYNEQKHHCWYIVPQRCFFLYDPALPWTTPFLKFDFSRFSETDGSKCALIKSNLVIEGVGADIQRGGKRQKPGAGRLQEEIRRSQANQSPRIAAPQRSEGFGCLHSHVYRIGKRLRRHIENDQKPVSLL